MKTRNIALTLEKAKEWYNSGNADLREVALQAYTEDELKVVLFSDIKTFKDACEALNLNVDDVMYDLSRVHFFGSHLTAIYKLDIIRKALNGDWKPDLIKGDIYYSWVRFYLPNRIPSNAYIIGKIKHDNQEYVVVGEFGDCGSPDGLGYFYSGYGYGDSSVSLGLLCCKSWEIAEHMSKYFGKIIFDACYAHHDNYEWIQE